MRVACIDPTSKVVLNIEVIIVETTTGSVGDIYIEGVGFFRFAGE